MTNKPLLPCPFCGGDGTIISNYLPTVGTFYRPECRSCLCSLKPYRTEEEAIAKWNRRHSPANDFYEATIDVYYALNNGDYETCACETWRRRHANLSFLKQFVQKYIKKLAVKNDCYILVNIERQGEYVDHEEIYIENGVIINE